jgi:hypothetical protein
MGIAVTLTGIDFSRAICGLSASAGTAAQVIATTRVAELRQTVRAMLPTLMELPPLSPRRRRHSAMKLPPGEVLIEQLGKLLGHHAGKLLCVGDRDGAPIIAGDIMANADCEQLH